MKTSLLSLCAICLTTTSYAAQEQPSSLTRWSFDSLEELGVTTPLHQAVQLVDGVRNKALIFDGYRTEIVCQPQKSPALGDRFTLSAWVAPQEYSWNLSAIINRQQDFQKGWFLGINQIGQLVGSLAMDSGWTTCASAQSLPLLKWSHVMMVCDPAKAITLYIDGAKVAETAISGQAVLAEDAVICIGKTQAKMTPALTERKTSQAIRSWMYFDGLIDEIEIRSGALTDAEARNLFEQTTLTNKQPLQYRKMPSGSDDPMPFGAYYTQLKYAPGWDARWRGSELPD